MYGTQFDPADVTLTVIAGSARAGIGRDDSALHSKPTPLHMHDDRARLLMPNGESTSGGRNRTQHLYKFTRQAYFKEV